MAIFTFTVADAQVPRVRAAFVATYTQRPGETAAALMLRKIREHVVSVVAQYESKVASDSARGTAADAVQNEVVIT